MTKKKQDKELPIIKMTTKEDFLRVEGVLRTIGIKEEEYGDEKEKETVGGYE